jgi:hypothetical protein
VNLPQKKQGDKWTSEETPLSEEVVLSSRIEGTQASLVDL